jgi:hypothetical protein
MTTYTRTTHPNLAGSRNSTALKMLFDAYLFNDQFLILEALKQLEFLDDLQRLNTACPGGSEIPERGERRRG